ncbi:malonic semialdehyde reductase [Streptomyces sp. NBC_01803]|uniref:malonic semialdehyde reductase n=1 Tax=Streptomyces sp. NBC_01803 TaxID=2975946 RepID=UPI002DDB9A57|nr:malonic semialdehyde reductase [Streptomyces sp. NBC_01803]WSA45975.1 malonic semialdehyde reductase [Streptomyces sp. NBC_01803]
MPLALDAAAQDLLFHQAHTARAFTDEPVTDEQVRAIYDLIKLAPTAHNSSPLRVTLLRSAEAKARLLPLLSEGNRAQTAAAPLTAILSLDLRFHEKLPKLFPVVPDLKDLAYADPEGRERAGLLSTGLQIGYFVLGVRAAGLAAGPMSGFDAGAVDKEFFGDGRQRALVVVNIGRPGDTAYNPRLPRLDFDEAVSVL